jgi:hypothetical protein
VAGNGRIGPHKESDAIRLEQQPLRQRKRRTRGKRAQLAGQMQRVQTERDGESGDEPRRL